MVLLIAYWWANQGLFSAIIHLLCVIVAGALALAFWEPVTVGLLLRGGGFDNYAWGFSLVVLFVLILFVLRLVTNRLIPANVALPHWADLSFGFPVGAFAGVLTVGILVIGIGFVHSQHRVLGFAGYSRDKTGRITETNRLWLPFHQITDEFYSLLSVGSLKTGTPLRHYQPKLYQQAASLVRDSYRGGRGQLVMRPSQVAVVSASVCTSRALITVRFERGALDYGEQLTLSASQIRLIGDASGFDRAHVAHPVRWRQPTKDAGTRTFSFDDNSHYVTTVPGREQTVVTIEFPWRGGTTPRFIQIKGARLNLTKVEEMSQEECEAAFRGGAAAAGVTKAPTDVYGARPLGPGQIKIGNDIRPVTTSTNVLPGTMKHVEKELVEGYALFPLGRTSFSRNLLIEGIRENPGTRIVQLDVSRSSAASLYGNVRKLAGADATPFLVDGEGYTYTAIGYIHEGTEGVAIRLDPTNGIQSVSELPHLPTSGNQKVRLIFKVTEGVTIVGVRLGSTPIASCNLTVAAKR